MGRLGERARRRRCRRPRAASIASSPRPWRRRRAPTPPIAGSTIAAWPLLAFGGAGPVHACAGRRAAGKHGGDLPAQASVLSAFGTLVTPVRLDLVRSALGRSTPSTGSVVDDRLLTEMSDEGAALRLPGRLRAGARCEPRFGADLRYVGQQNEAVGHLRPRRSRARNGRDTGIIAAHLRRSLSRAIRRQSVPCAARDRELAA